MLASRSIFRVTFQAWDSANNRAGSILSHQFQQTCMFSHGLRSELKMGRKGKKIEIDGKKQKSMTISTEPSFCQGDNETKKLQSQLGEAYHTISSNVSATTTENTNSEVLNEPVDADSCHRTENSNNDASEDGKLIPPEKHSLSMDVGSSLWRFIKGKVGHTQEEIEQETQVKVIFPSSKKGDSIKTAEGDKKRSRTSSNDSQEIHIPEANGYQDFQREGISPTLVRKYFKQQKVNTSKLTPPLVRMGTGWDCTWNTQKVVPGVGL